MCERRRERDVEGAKTEIAGVAHLRSERSDDRASHKSAFSQNG